MPDVRELGDTQDAISFLDDMIEKFSLLNGYEDPTRSLNNLRRHLNELAITASNLSM